MENIILNAFPSIRESISVQHSEAPRNQVVEEPDSDDDDLYHDSTDAGFSFDMSAVNNSNITSDLTADEIFHRGRIVPLYSVSNHTPVSVDDDTDTDASPIHPEANREYFDTPKIAPGSPIKSWSTGTTTKQNTIREFLFKGSRSDGKEKLGFFEKGSSGVGSKTKKSKKKDKEKGKRKVSTDTDKTDYTKNSETGIIVKPKEKDLVTRKRRSFLPYMGFFGAGRIHDFTKKFF